MGRMKEEFTIKKEYESIAVLQNKFN